jgi:uncharacterized protein
VPKHHRPAASPYVFSLREFVRRPGEQRESSTVFPAPAVLGTDVIGVPEGGEVSLDVRFDSLAEGVWVDGTITADAVGECSRCLDEVRLTVSPAIQGLFTDAEVEVGDEEDPSDVYEFDGDVIDLEELVRDAVVTALPFIPLCELDCPGLCDQCGARLADDPDHAHDVIDPRWSALQGLTETKES